MRKKNFKPMIISALLAIGFGATSVGTSFALFTDHADTAINVTAGKVDVNAEIKIDSVASLNPATIDTHTVKNSDISAAFENGGSATVETNATTGVQTVKLSKLTPGDKVVLLYTTKNLSNVDIKTKFSKSWSDVVVNGSYKLSDVLTVDVELLDKQTSEYNAYQKTNVWEKRLSTERSDGTNAVTLDTFKITVTFPDSDEGKINFNSKDNNYMGLESDLTIALEAVQGNAITENDKYSFYNSYTENGHWVHLVANKAQFKNIMTHIATYKNVTKDGYPLADSSTEYVIINDIDFGGSLWSKDDPVYSETFMGVLRSNGGKVKLSNVINKKGVSGSLAKSDDPVLIGLFNRAVNAKFENITLSNFVLEDTTADYCGFFVTGNKEGSDNYIEFTNCEVLDDCSLHAHNAAAAFMPLARKYLRATFTNCINRADISAVASQVAAFAGNGTSQPSNSEFSFINCENYGDMSAGSIVAAIFGNLKAVSKVTVQGGGNYGDIYVNDNNSFRGGIVTSGGTNTDDFAAKVLIEDFKNLGNVYCTTDSGEITTTNMVKASEYYYFDNVNRLEFGAKDATTSQAIDTKAKYMSYFKVGLPVVGITFDANEDYLLKATKPASVEADDIAKVVVTLSMHCLKMGTDGKEYPYNMGGENNRNFSFEYNSLSDIDIKRVGQAGFFVPTGYAAPTSPYTQFDRYLLTEGTYSEGYTKRADGKSYIVLNNANPAGMYNAISIWRNRVEYAVEAYDSNDVLLARGTEQYGWTNDGYDSLITAITD